MFGEGVVTQENSVAVFWEAAALSSTKYARLEKQHLCVCDIVSGTQTISPLNETHPETSFGRRWCITSSSQLGKNVTNSSIYIFSFPERRSSSSLAR